MDGHQYLTQDFQVTQNKSINNKNYYYFYYFKNCLYIYYYLSIIFLGLGRPSFIFSILTIA